MNKLAMLTAAAALASTGAVAQTSPAPATGPTPSARAARPDFASLVDARVAAIQAGLKLTPDQQRLWPPVEQAIRSVATEAGEAAEPRRPPRESLDYMQGLERRSERTAEQAQRLRTLATAVGPLWASLDERQKRLLPVLMRPVEGLAYRQAGMRGSDESPRGPGTMGRGGPGQRL